MDYHERYALVSDLIDAETQQRALAGSVEDRRRILVLLALADLRAPAERRADVARAWIEHLNRKEDNWISAVGYDYCASLAREFVAAGQPLPHPLDQFMLDVLDGRISRAERGPRKHLLDHRDAAILSAIYAALHTRGDPISATRNEASNPNSACDLVRECLERFGIFLSYRAVADVWETWRADLAAYRQKSTTNGMSH